MISYNTKLQCFLTMIFYNTFLQHFLTIIQKSALITGRYRMDIFINWLFFGREITYKKSLNIHERLRRIELEIPFQV